MNMSLITTLVVLTMGQYELRGVPRPLYFLSRPKLRVQVDTMLVLVSPAFPQSAVVGFVVFVCGPISLAALGSPQQGAGYQEKNDILKKLLFSFANKNDPNWFDVAKKATRKNLGLCSSRTPGNRSACKSLTVGYRTGFLSVSTQAGPMKESLMAVGS